MQCIFMGEKTFKPLGLIEAACPRTSLMNGSEKQGCQVHKTTSLEMQLHSFSDQNSLK